jgi:phage/plasmid-like protein (TIGR03299 family)
MSHNLMIQNGRASMFYVEDVPWHGLGTRLDRPATAQEAIQTANLDWTVRKLPLHATVEGRQITVPDTYAVVRDDPSHPPVLGVVSKDYTPLQNSEAFGFFDPIVGENAAVYHTAGALGQGERIWLLAKLPRLFRIAGDDVAEPYLLLTNGHDGKSSVTVKFTTVRVVCQNTLTLALHGGESFRVVHTTDVKHRLRGAGHLLARIQRRHDTLEASMKTMARVQVNRSRLAEYLTQVFPDGDPADEAAVLRARRSREWSEYFFDQGKGNRLPGVRGSVWAAFNGVTEWLDHRKTRQNPHQRLTSIWFGDNYRTKARAFELADEKAAVWMN